MEIDGNTLSKIIVGIISYLLGLCKNPWATYQKHKYKFDAELGVYRKKGEDLIYCPKCYHENHFVPMSGTGLTYNCSRCKTRVNIPGSEYPEYKILDKTTERFGPF
jgi:DNA-directed RNA polymerase subunit RPC12/RpoP